MSTLKTAIHGAAGRMGQRLIALVSADDQFRLVGALEYHGHPKSGVDAGDVAGVGKIGVRLSSDWSEKPDVVIDFSLPTAVDAIVAKCCDERVPLVVATTGLQTEQQARLKESGGTIPIVWAPSMSLAVNLTMKLTSIAGETLRSYPGGVDVEVVERHHRFKEDAPSGTALRFGQLIADAMGQTKHVHGRHGQTGARQRDEIGYHALRVGDNSGEHAITFGMLGETIELSVKASNRDCYAAGALTAAKFVASQKPGIYTMFDVLKL